MGEERESRQILPKDTVKKKSIRVKKRIETAHVKAVWDSKKTLPMVLKETGLLRNLKSNADPELKFMYGLSEDS